LLDRKKVFGVCAQHVNAIAEAAFKLAPQPLGGRLVGIRAPAGSDVSLNKAGG